MEFTKIEQILLNGALRTRNKYWNFLIFSCIYFLFFLTFFCFLFFLKFKDDVTFYIALFCLMLGLIVYIITIYQKIIIKLSGK